MTRRYDDYQGHPRGAYQSGGYDPSRHNGRPPSKTPVWVKVMLGVLFGLILLFAMGMCTVAVISSGDNNDDTTVTTDDTKDQSTTGNKDKSTKSKKGSGPAFQGKTDKDTSVKFGETITKDKVSITASVPKSTDDGFGTPTMCSTVTITNGSSKQESFNLFDWNIQNPDGASTTPDTPLEGGLSSGEIAPGGKTSGKLCLSSSSSSKPAKGQYALIYSGSIFSSDRLVWVGTL